MTTERILEQIASFTAIDIMVLAAFECRRYERTEFYDTVPLVYLTAGDWVGRMQRLGIVSSDGVHSRGHFLGFSYVEFRAAPFMEACQAIKAQAKGGLPPLPGNAALAMLASLPVGGYPRVWHTCSTNQRWMRQRINEMAKSGIVLIEAEGNWTSAMLARPWQMLVQAFREVLATPPTGVRGKAIYQRGIETVWISSKPWRHLTPYTAAIELPGVKGHAYFRGARQLNALDLELLAARARLGLTWQSESPPTADREAWRFSRFSLPFLMDSRVKSWFHSYGFPRLNARVIEIHLAARGFPEARPGRLLGGRPADFPLAAGRSMMLARGQPPIRRPSRRSS